MKLSNRIKEFRARHNMRQEQLAELVGVRRETIGRLEMNKYNPSLMLALDIANVFEVNVEEIFHLEKDKA